MLYRHQYLWHLTNVNDEEYLSEQWKPLIVNGKAQFIIKRRYKRTLFSSYFKCVFFVTTSIIFLQLLSIGQTLCLWSIKSITLSHIPFYDLNIQKFVFPYYYQKLWSKLKHIFMLLIKVLTWYQSILD